MPLNSLPTVSVIIPVYNGAQYIQTAIDSVLKQTYKNIEIIVVDDGSTDQLTDALNPYIKANTIRYVYQLNRGLSAARNTGIRASSGKYLKFLDCDDFLYPKQIELQISHLHEKNNIISITDHILSFENGKEIISNIQLDKSNQLARLIVGNFTPVHSVLVETSLINQAGGFDEDLKALEDADLWLRLLLKGVRFEKIDYVGCSYRILNESLSSNPDKMFRMKCRISEKLNTFIMPTINKLELSIKDALLINNTKLIEGCFVRKINPKEYLSKTLVCSEALVQQYKNNFFKKIFLKIFGYRIFIYFKYLLSFISIKNYKNALIYDEIKWRNSENLGSLA